MHAAQVLEKRWKDIQAHGHAARQPKRAAQHPRPIGDGGNRVAQIQKHAVPELHEAFGRRRHPHLTADAQKQGFAELLLEQQDLPADRRLRNVELSSTGAERSRFGDCLKDLELAQVHVTPRR